MTIKPRHSRLNTFAKTGSQTGPEYSREALVLLARFNRFRPVARKFPALER